MPGTPGRPSPEDRRREAARREAEDALRRAEIERQNKKRYSAAAIRDAARAAEAHGKAQQEAAIAREAKAAKKKGKKK